MIGVKRRRAPAVRSPARSRGGGRSTRTRAAPTPSRSRPTAAAWRSFRADGSITRVSLADQQRKVVTSGADLTGGLAWSPAGIVFGRGGALWIVSPEGGTPRALTALDAARHEVLHATPSGAAWRAHRAVREPDHRAGGERIEAVSIDGGPRSVVVERATTPVWSPTGHLLFARDGAVLAAAFDPLTATLRGAAVPVMPAGAVEELATGDLGLGVSSTGPCCTCRPVSRTNAWSRWPATARRWPSICPRAATRTRGSRPTAAGSWSRAAAGTSRRSISARGTRARLTAAAFGTLFSTWTADGNRVVFRRFDLPFWARADGSGDAAPCPPRPSTTSRRRRGPIPTPSSSSASGPRRRGTSS